jgi:hypothetical protein
MQESSGVPLQLMTQGAEVAEHPHAGTALLRGVGVHT